MRRTKHSDDELRWFAEAPIEYEVRMLLCHAWEFLQERPDGMLGTGLRHNSFDALLEAWLVHIRLMDDFLRHGQSKKRAAIARDWQPHWRSEGFLKNEHRAVLNDQLTHLSWNRERWNEAIRPPWEGQISQWTDACCTELLRFFGEVPSDLSSAFDLSRSYAEAWLRSGTRPA